MRTRLSKKQAAQLLPRCALHFLDDLQVGITAGTCTQYRTSLVRLYRFLAQERSRLKKLKRTQVLHLLRVMKEEGLHPNTRLKFIFQTRIYLRWLHERKLLDAHPDDLFRRIDLPKLPSYLPRPLPFELDKLLQHELAQRDSIYCRALLLMRNTGIRIGELMALPHDCVTTDINNQAFLKVPLGKTNNERNVPLDSRTLEIIATIRGLPPSRRLFLLPREKSMYQLRANLVATLDETCRDLPCDGRVTSHRLRHSYATSFINSGMSLLGVMKLLGHRDYRMTLRYTAVSQQSVLKEYHAALDKMQVGLQLSLPPSQATSPDPCLLLDDAILGLTKLAQEKHISASLKTNLAKRIKRIRQVIQDSLVPANIAG